MSDQLDLAIRRAHWTPKQSQVPAITRGELDELTSRLRKCEDRLALVEGQQSQSEAPIPMMPGLAGQATVRRIVDLVCKTYDVTPGQLLGPQRHRFFTWPRHIAVFLCSELTAQSLPAIGRHFHRDHTTILHSRDLVRQRGERDAEFYREVRALEEKLKVKNEMV